MSNLILDFKGSIKDLGSQLRELQNNKVISKSSIQKGLEALKNKLYNNKLTFDNITPWQRVQLARHPNRPHFSDYIDRICSDFIELHGDKRYSDDTAMICGFSKIGEFCVMLIGTQKGRGTDDNIYRNFGCPQPEGYRKALRFMKLAEKAKIPIVTIIDTPGAYPGVTSEERHVGESIATNLMEMFNIKVPIISVIIGEGGSGGALGIGVGNKILMLEHAYYSVITPEGCSAILWPNQDYAPRVSELLKITSHELLKFGIIDEIVKEPLSGAHNDYDAIANELKSVLIRYLRQIDSYNVNDILKDRYSKYRKIGHFINR